MRLTLQKSLVFFLALLYTSVIFSQGTLRGVISDSLSRKPLVGANVFLLGTALGSATNIEGEYLIKPISEGTYTVKISYLGYKSSFQELVIFDNKTTQFDVKLSPDIIEGEEVVVTGQLSGQMSAINQQRTSNTIVNVISEEKIQELPDVNAAEVIGRLPGVALQRSGGEANKIVLRGLSDKFSTVTIDGIRIAATDPDARGVDLSTISQGSLAGIELYKALLADMDADAIAGSVNLVTKKAPSIRLIRLDSKGAYNKMNKTIKQYDFALRYGERFFDDLLGVQLIGNLEQRDRSNERLDLDYGSAANNVNDYEISDFKLEYINETRYRGGGSILLDVNTPDNGNIRFNTIFNSTTRDYITFSRNYPTGSADLLYTARDREQKIKTFNSSVRGENNLFGLETIWGGSFGQSNSENPYDYSLDFVEPSILDSTGKPISKMKTIPNEIKKGPPEALIPLALNNYQKAFLNWGYYRFQKNIDKEKTAFLDIKRKYSFGGDVSGEFKIGGKYRYKNRFKESSELDAAYYLYGFHKYNVLPDGTVHLKNFAGTRFENLMLSNIAVISSNFLNNIPDNRNIYGRYLLNPMVNRDALRDWYELNKHGAANSNGSSPEYSRNIEVEANYYDITERISAGYLMNTLNLGQTITLISGLRVENEDNDYQSKFTPGKLTGFPSPSGVLKDTSADFNETIWLPNFNLSIRPLNFLTVRFAVYRALARPDFNHRLENFVARDGGGATTLVIGNSKLKAAKAWNFEINTSIFHNDLGLFSVSAFYKDIKDMFHLVNNIRVDRAEILDSLGITWKSPFASSQLYDLTYPYNSSKPTRVWGFEIEHQANLLFLPGLLQHLVLSYNFSFVRSETYVASSKTVVWKDSINVLGTWIPIDKSKIELEETKNKLEGQPEFFGNVSIGYDIEDFSGRLSIFYQSEFNSLFSGDRKSDRIVNKFTRWDLALKYQLSDNFAFFFNLNNFTNYEEGTSIVNRVQNWTLLNTSERYDLTADLGVRVSL